MKTTFLNRFIHFLFFGNFFYGLCALSLSIETSLQLNLASATACYYALIFCGTVMYYTHAYLITDSAPVVENQRSIWYSQNKTFLYYTQALLFCLILFSGTCIYYAYREALFLSPGGLSLALVFPLVSFMYYGVSGASGSRISLRRLGLIKPFVIGFVWAGMVTLYPALFHAMVNGQEFEAGSAFLLLFFKNFMFVSVLAIMFDIKDYTMDYNERLKTFVVKLGLRKTLFYLIMPMCAAGIVLFMYDALWHHFSPVKIALNLIPYAAILLVAWALQNRKPILYYLFIIDGIMLLKGICGSLASIYVP